MTNSRIASNRFVSGPSRKTRTASTLRLRHLMEAQQKLEIAERITALRERSPFGQQDVADKLGIGLRAYQKLERVGTTKFDRCEEIAKIHSEWAKRDEAWEHLSPEWIWDGREVNENPDLMDALAEATTPGVRELSETVEELRREVAEMSALLLSEVETRRTGQASSRSKKARPSRPRKSTRK